MVEGFILLAYILGTAFGWYMGSSKGHKDGIVDTIDSLIAALSAIDVRCKHGRGAAKLGRWDKIASIEAQIYWW